MPRWRWFLQTALASTVGLCAISSALAQKTGPLDVVFVLDQSGSMKVNDPEQMVGQAVSRLIDHLRPEDAAGLVLFGSKAWVVQPLNRMAQGQREALQNFIAQIRYADAQTNFAAGIESGLSEFRSRGRSDSTQVLIFVTDGKMDTGIPDQDVEMKARLREQLLSLARQRGVRIFSIAFTSQADLELVREMADATEGKYFQALNAAEIAVTFRQIAAELQKPPKTITAPAPPVSEAPPAVTRSKPETQHSGWLIGGLFIVLVLGLSAILWRWREWFPRLATPVPPAKLMDLKTGKPISLDKVVIRIGRKADNDLVISVPTVSGYHATIKFRQGQFYLRDLNSTNETKVNGQKVKGEVLLKSGDILRFDEFGYTFMGPEPSEDATLIRKDVTDSSGTVVRKEERTHPENPRWQKKS